MAECTYDFTGPDGKPVRIQGKAEFKAYLANGGLEHFGINLQSDKGDAKFSRGSQTDSKEFKAWFAKSKVVDASGNPLVVYHGSRNDFSVFDYSKIGEQGRGEGAGFYFTNSRDVASGYGKPMEVFLSIQKPLAYDAKPFTKPTIQKIVRRVAELEAKGEGGDIADGFLSNFGDVRSSGLQSVVRDAADLIAADETAVDQLSGIVGSGVNAQYVNRATTDVTGFDGVVADGFSNRGDGSNRIYVAFHPEQIKSATNNAGTFDPANPDIRYSFAGQSSQTADKHALSSAQSRLDAGESAEKVRQDTGWFKGNDGKWRYEISDADARLKTWTSYWGRLRNQEKTYDLSSILDHPKLFAAYPELKKVRVWPASDSKFAGGFNEEFAIGDDGVMVHVIELNFDQLKNDEDALSVLLHEIQHGIQTVEGFAAGGSPTDAKVKEEGRQMVRRDLAEGRISEDTNPADLLPMAYHNAYRRLAGEVEARNTQARQSMTDDERRATPPSKTADVADSDVIVMFNGKVMASAPTPANAQMSRGRNTEQLHAEDFDAGLRIAQRAFPGVKIIGHASDRAPTVPLSLRQSIKKADAIGDVKGAYHEGAVHIFNNATPDLGTLEFTVAHEATHFGLAGMFGADIDPVMLNINRSNPEIQALAKELQDNYGYSIARSTEEALADMGGDMVKVRGWDKLVSFIRDFLRKHGFVREWTDTDIAALVMRARDYAKNPRATSFYRDNVFSQNLTKGRNVGNVPGMDDAKNVAGKQAPNPAGDVEQGGAASSKLSPGARVKDKWGDKYTIVGPDPKDSARVLALQDGSYSPVSMPTTNIAGGAARAVAKEESDKLRLYHGSPESRLNEIRDDGKFRGLFMSPNKQNATGLASSSSEQHLHVSELDKKLVAKHGDLNNLSARKRAVARKVVSDLISKKATPKEVTIVLDAALDDKEFVSDLSTDEKEVVTRVTASLDDGDASWEVQMIRGQIAKALGYKAVAMRDEQGTSYLALPGVDIQPLNEQSTSAGSDVVYSRTSLISPAQRALTRTDAFKEWFGSSKMTAQDGTPLLFMHGSPTSFEAFDAGKLGASSAHTSSGLGHFFTRDAATASKYADGGIVYRGWLKIERPYVMPLKEAQSFKDTKASVARRGELQKQGYDGAVILDDQGKPWATVAFDPWQFKSTENNGNFDEFDDRFRFSRANQGQAGAWPIEPIGKGDRFIYNMQDKQIDTKRVVEAAKKSGVKVTDDINPYLQEELYHGRSAKKFDDFRNKELRPLLDSIRSAGLSLADVESYLWASHAKERNAQIAKINDKMPDGGSGLTNKQADDLLAGRNVTVNGNEIKGVSQSALPALQGIAKQVQAINAATRQMLVDSGMETADTIKAWEGAYSNYVPLHREDIEQGGMGTGMGFSVRGSASKRAIGSGRTVVDILGNIANQRERQIARVEKNRVGQAVLGLAKSAPNEDFWKVDDVPMMKTVEATPVFTAYDKAGNVLGTYSTQLQADRAHPSSGVTIRRTVEDKVKSRMDPTFRSRDEVFHVRVDGKDHFVTFNPQDERALRMATAMKNLDADQLGAVLQVTSKATRFFASMATQYNPIWGVVNLTRDVQGALLNLSTTSLRGKEKEVLGHTISALKGIYADLRAHRAGKNPSSKWASLFEEMQDEGGQTGYKDMFGNAKDRTEALERELDPTKWMKSPLGRVFTADGRLKVPMEIAQKRAEGFFGWLSDFNQTTENAIRLASYKTAVDNGMSKQQAASIAKNVSINFNRKGQVATQAGALYAFFNASMQGSARLAETLRGPLGKKIIKGGLALGVMQAMMLAAAGMGDDEPPEFVRERSFIIPIGDGKYISIPLPLGFHVLPNLSRIPTEYAMSGFKNGGKRIADMFGLVANTFNPIGNAGLSLQTIAPTVIDPLAALAENKDWTGKKIAKEDMSSLHPTPGYLRAKDTASELSKFMAQLFNAASGGTEFKQGMFSPTPDHLDYLIGQIAGGVGREALKIDQTLSSAVTGEELPMHKVPLLGRFVGDTKGQSAESGKFYAALTRINEHQAELKGLRASGRGAEAAEYARENPEAVLAPMATATERALSEDRKLKRKAVEAGNSELVKQIEARSSARMKAFNDRLSALEN